MADDNKRSPFLMGPTGTYYGYHQTLTEEQKDDRKRTAAGIITSLPREALELARALTEPSTFPSRLELERQERGEGIELLSAEEKKKREKARLERIKKQEDVIEQVYSKLVGADNVERLQRGDYSVAEIKRPVNEALDISRSIAEIGVGLAAGTKISAVSKAKTTAGKILRQLGAGEIGAQLSIDPYNDMKLFPKMIGSMISEQDGNLGVIKEYLEADAQKKSQLENRIDLLADGLLFSTGLWTGGKLLEGGKYTYNKVVTEEFRKQFKTHLNNIAKQGKENINRYISNIRDERDKASKDLSLWHRQADVQNGKVIGAGDVAALEPSKFTKWISDVNLQFSTSPLLRKFENYRLKLFSTRGGKTRQLNEKFLRAENAKEQWSDNILNTATNIENAVDDIVRTAGPNKEDVLRKIDRILYTDFRTPTLITERKGISLGRRQKETFERELKKLPEELQTPVRRARELQDRLSKLMTETDLLTDTQKQIYLDNYGFYVRRSYKLFEDPNYVPTPKALKDAREFIGVQFRKQDSEAGRKISVLEENNYNNEIDQRVDAFITKTLDRKSTSNKFFADLNKFDTIRKSILQGKKDIPAPIRNLFGEVEEPVEKLIHSTTKLSRIVEDLKFYDAAYNDGKGLYFKETPIGIFTEEVPQGYGKLSGQFTSPELVQYFSNYRTFGQNILEDSGITSTIYRTSLLLKGAAQAAKTVFSHATHAVNIMGGAWMSLANGVNIFNKKQGQEIINVLRARTKNDIELQKFHEELSGRGILNKGVIARDLMGLANDIQKIKSGFVVGKVDWMFKKVPVPYWSAKNKKIEFTTPSNVADKVKNLYVAEDDFFKINMYLEEEKLLTRFNDSLSDGHRLKKTSEGIKDEAALMVRDTLPNYDLVPEWLQNLRRNPAFGKFFSFMSESVRITTGTIKRGIDEVKQGKALIQEGEQEAGTILRNRGLKRLAAFTALGAGGSKGIEEASKALAGFNKEDIDAAKDFQADYFQNTDVFVSVGPDGTPMLADVGRLDPYQFPKQPFQITINKLLNDDRISDEGILREIFTTTMTEMASPFLGFSMIQEDIAGYLTGGRRVADNRLMTNPFDRKDQFDDSGTYPENILNPDNINILLSNIMYDLVPSSFTRTTDWIDEIGKERTEFDQDIYQNLNFLRFLTGIGFEPLNKEYIQNIYEFKATDFLKQKGFRRNRLYRAIGDELNIDEFTNAYLKENQLYYKAFSKFHKTTKSAERFNLDTITAQKEAGVSKQDRNVFNFSNDFQPLGLTPGLKESLLEKAKTYEDYINVLTDISMLDTTLSNLPVLFNKDHYKIQKEEVQELQEFLREQRVTGGLIEGPKVPFTKANPADRIDPFTGRPYQNEIERLGLADGGPISRIINSIGEMVGIGYKEQRQNEKEAAALINKAVADRLIPEREGIQVDKYGFVAGNTGDVFNAVNHALLSYKYGDSFLMRTGLQVKEGLQAFKKPKDSALDALNNRFGMELRNRVKDQEEANKQIIDGVLNTYSTLEAGQKLQPGKNLYLNFEDI